jgi:propanol-preferring alcohol dehydrogenase
MAELIPGLVPRGKLIVLSVPNDPIPTSAYHLVFGGRVVMGSLTGRVIEGQDTLAFSELQGVSPMVETMPFEQAPEAYARMMRGDARFRIVLTMTELYPAFGTKAIGVNRRD